MNVADARRMASALEKLGYEDSSRVEEADVIVMVTCVVRQSAEDRAVGRLQSLQPLKKKKPGLVINLMGCLVGVKDHEPLRKRFPFVDVFSPPSDLRPLVEFLIQRDGQQMTREETEQRFALLDEDLALPASERGNRVSSYISIMNGCSHACSYCIIPYRRGAEHSRPPEEILSEARALVSQGVREITLLGQIVDRYGVDQPGYPSLAELLRSLHEIEGLNRLRFLTSHPNWMTDDLLDAVAELPRVMAHIEVPIQAGDDEVLRNMRRGYTQEQYRRLIERIRSRIPGVSIGTDIIVGFPAETAEQFQQTYNLLADLKLDVAHLARYSPRSGTLSERTMADDVPDEEKWRRFRLLEELQKEVVAEINQQYIGQNLPVLFEDVKKGRWVGRSPNNKLVFVESEKPLIGQEIPILIHWASAWAMRGTLL